MAPSTLPHSSQPPSWQTLLNEALTRPGVVSEAYSRFHDYSVGNQILALTQCWLRGLQPGPISTYMGWHALGRHVKRGEKAITLCMPVTCRKTHQATPPDGQEEDREEVFTRFVYRNNWFVLSQTDGQEYQPEPLPQWDADRALAVLGIRRETFDELNGNIQGYAKPGHVVALSPIASMPHKTLFHELGHVLLGHLEQGSLTDSESTPRNLMEIEAEAVALLCCESLGLGGGGVLTRLYPGLGERRNQHSRTVCAEDIPRGGAHAVLRMLGAGVIQIGRTEAQRITEVASAYGVPKGHDVCKGSYEFAYEGNRKAMTFRKITSAKAGAHEVFWAAFTKRMRGLSNDVLSSRTASTTDNQVVSAKLGELCENLTYAGSNDGAWLSLVRNDVNYRHGRGAWFPYAGERSLPQKLFRARDCWLCDPMAIRMTEVERGDLGRFQNTCQFLIGLCRALAVDMATRCPTGNSFHTYGSLALLNLLGLAAARTASASGSAKASRS